MSITWTQHTTAIGLPFAITKADGTPLNLSAIAANAITLKVRRVDGGLPRDYTALAGFATFDNAAQGLFTYTFADADVASPGKYLLIVSLNFGVIGPDNSFPVDFTVV